MSTRSARSFTHRSRERIKAAKLEKKLIQFVNGEIEMSRVQVSAATKLLDKVMPNLRAVEIQKIEPESKSHREMTDEELFLEIYRLPGGAEMFYEVIRKWRSEFVREASA